MVGTIELSREQAEQLYPVYDTAPHISAIEFPRLPKFEEKTDESLYSRSKTLTTETQAILDRDERRLAAARENLL